MKRRTVIWLSITAIAITLIIIALVLFLMIAAVRDDGSTSLATEWRAELEKYPDPDAARVDPTITIVRFDDGAWVMGKAQDSHGGWRQGGGTLVVRNSQGNTRAFFGHVCGPSYLKMHRSEASLDVFYERLKEEGFAEYRFDRTDSPATTHAY